MFDDRTNWTCFQGQIEEGTCMCLNDLVDADASPTVRDVLKSRHPPVVPVHRECLITDTDPALVYHPMIFEAFDGSVIRAAALRTSGAAGPSGVDAYGWRCLCTVFRSASDELCSFIVLCMGEIEG